MVSIIENFAAIEGKIVSVDDHPTRSGYVQMKLALTKSTAVEGYPNLAQADEGSTIAVNIKKEEAHSVQGKKTFSAVVKKAPGQEYFVK